MRNLLTDLSLKILFDATAGGNLKSKHCGKKMYFFEIDSDMTSKNRTFVDDCGAWNRPSLNIFVIWLQTQTHLNTFTLTKIVYEKRYMNFTRYSRCKFCYFFAISFKTQKWQQLSKEGYLIPECARTQWSIYDVFEWIY